MKIKSILCPIDYSFSSKAANYYASLFADASGAQIIYLNVNWPPTNEPIKQRLEHLHLKLSNEIRPFIRSVRHRFVVREGDPASSILKLAEEHSVDLIVMGTHGTSGLERLLHGSVCGKVLRNSKCPVMAVKNALKVDWIIDKESQPTIWEDTTQI